MTSGFSPGASAVESAWAHSETSGTIECVHTGRSSLQTQTQRYGLLIPAITVLNIESERRNFLALNLFDLTERKRLRGDSRSEAAAPVFIWVFSAVRSAEGRPRQRHTTRPRLVPAKPTGGAFLRSVCVI